VRAIPVHDTHIFAAATVWTLRVWLQNDSMRAAVGVAVPAML
jgi:hypothetical protein